MRIVLLALFGTQLAICPVRASPQSFVAEMDELKISALSCQAEIAANGRAGSACSYMQDSMQRVYRGGDVQTYMRARMAAGDLNEATGPSFMSAFSEVLKALKLQTP
ncbi:hypothetical protein [Teichococcus deserti]|uniref:hypothetical protein n=1 Tax=Teichococcus deserti TaxID=1817963 RepID=UPI001056C1E2|nr:hypothetical protein [Pseudoroseomonas deserti]